MAASRETADGNRGKEKRTWNNVSWVGREEVRGMMMGWRIDTCVYGAAFGLICF
jgi:hypothetical protein